MHSLTKLTVLLLCSWGFLGCSGGGDEVEKAELTGEVKSKSGEPVGGVTVVFYPASGPSAAAKTDEAGQFTAEVPVGECKVAVIAAGTASSDDTSQEALEALAKAEAESKVDAKYAVPETSGLSVTVKPGENEKAVFVVD